MLVGDFEIMCTLSGKFTLSSVSPLLTPLEALEFHMKLNYIHIDDILKVPPLD